LDAAIEYASGDLQADLNIVTSEGLSYPKYVFDEDIFTINDKYTVYVSNIMENATFNYEAVELIVMDDAGYERFVSQ